MTIKIIATVDRIAMKDTSDIRSFIEGEFHELTPDNEAHLLALGIAEPAVVAPTPAAEAAERVVDAPAHESAPAVRSDAPAAAVEPVATVPATAPPEPAAAS